MYPPMSEARRKKIKALKSNYHQGSKINICGITQQEKAKCASLKVAWVLARNNKPFTDSEIFKECMVTVLEELPTDKAIEGIIVSVKQVSLSATTAARRIHVLADDVERSMLDGIHKHVSCD